MNKKFIDYMKGLVESVGLEVNESNEIILTNGKNVKTEGLNIVIPDDTNINNMSHIVDGKVVEKYKIFNPFSEDDIKRNYMLTLLSRYMSSFSTVGVSTIMHQLIILLEDEQLQDRMHTSIQKFIVQLRERLGNKGKLVSKRTITSYTKFNTYLVENGLSIVKYRIARGDTINGVKYNRIAKLDPIAIDNLAGREVELGISERDREVFLAMIEFIIPDLKNTMTGSKSTKYPSYIALLDLYNEIQTRINFLSKELVEVLDASVVQAKLVDTKIEQFSTDIDFLPNANKLETKTSNVIPNKSVNLSLADLQDSVITNSSGVRIGADDISKVSDDPLDALIASTYGKKNQHGFINTGNTTIITGGMNNTQSGTLSLQESLMRSQQANNIYAGLTVDNGFNIGTNTGLSGSLNQGINIGLNQPVSYGW
jgi:hypothetical protein